MIDDDSYLAFVRGLILLRRKYTPWAFQGGDIDDVILEAKTPEELYSRCGLQFPLVEIRRWHANASCRDAVKDGVPKAQLDALRAMTLGLDL